MKLAIFRALFWVWFFVRGYYRWSKFWMAFTEGRYSMVNLTPSVSLGQLEEALSKMTWKADPGKGLFDTISSPHRVEFVLRQRLAGMGKGEVGDCDEFALYAAVSVEDMIKRGRLDARNPEFMSVTWLDAKGNFHGHNVCVFEDSHGWNHMSNWFEGKVQSGAHPGHRFASPKEIALWFSQAEDQGELIGYARATTDLKLKEICLS